MAFIPGEGVDSMLNTKDLVIILLKERKYDEIAEMVAGDRTKIRYLRRLLYEPGTLLCWRAIEAMGVVAGRLAEEDPQAVRLILRNLLWAINEESGGIGWASVEAMGEIVSRRPDLYGDYASIILFHVDEEMLRRGVMWAAGQIARASPDLVRRYIPMLAPYVDDPDPVVRGYTLRFLGIMREKLDREQYGHLLQDTSIVPVYGSGEIRQLTVAELAAGVVEKIAEPGCLCPGVK